MNIAELVVTKASIILEIKEKKKILLLLSEIKEGKSIVHSPYSDDKTIQYLTKNKIFKEKELKKTYTPTGCSPTIIAGEQKIICKNIYVRCY